MEPGEVPGAEEEAGTTPSDDGASVAAEGEGEGEAAPEPAAGPELPRVTDWDCPQGAEPMVVGVGEDWEHSVCKAAEGRECEPGFAQFFGPDCVRVGTECPQARPGSEWVRERAPGFDGPILHVSKAGGALGGSFGSIGLAVGSDPEEGSIIVVGPGIWSEAVVLSRRVAIVGWCPQEVVLQGLTPDAGQSVVHFAGEAGGRITNLSFGGPNGSDVAVRLQGRHPSEVEDVIIAGARRAGVFFMEGGAGGVARNVVVREGEGTGVGVSQCQPVRIEGLQVQSVGGAGVLIFNADGDEERGVHVQDARIDDVGLHGVQFSECNNSSLARAVVSRPNIDGVLAVRRSAHPEGVVSVDVEDLYVVDAVADGVDPLRAFEAYGGQEVHARRVGMIGPKQYSLLAIDQEAGELVLDYDQLYIAHTSPPREGEGAGYGAALMGNVRGRIARIVVDHAESVGIAASTWRGDRFPDLRFEDVVVADTLSPNGVEAGYGFMAFDGATVTLERALLVGNRDIGLVSWGWGAAPETRMTATDVTILDTEPASCDAMAYPPPRCEVREDLDLAGGNGLLAGQGGRLSVDRFLVRRSAKSGVVVGEEGILRGADGAIERNAIGINLLDEDYDVSALKDVRFEDNDTDVGQQQIRPPDPGGLLAEIE